MSVKLVFVFIFCLHFTSYTNGARILGVFPMAAPSHYFLGHALMKGLAEAGHDVTMVSPFEVKEPPKNGSWRDIVLEGVMEQMKKKFEEIGMFNLTEMSALKMLFFFNLMGNTAAEQALSHPNLQKLIHSNEKFDVVIIPQFVADGLKSLAHHFEGHLIIFSNIAANSWINPLVGNPTLPSLQGEVLLGMPKRMNFFQRLYNTFFHVVSMLNINFILYPMQTELSKKYIPDAIDLNEANSNISLVLLNSHTSIFDPQPLVPCMVEIGGFHVNPPKKLPADLQKYLDEAKEGVIYFSMGSNLRSAQLPVEKRDALLKAFSKRKEKVLWKWETDVLPGQPPNVKLGKWLPQQDILAHPNVKVFVTHGGLLSTTETVYHGVPIVAIPVLGDQQMNARGAQQAGYGLVLPYKELTEEKLTPLLEEILSNPRYRDTVKEKSRIMNDRQVSPLQTAVYWVEYVIRHNGAKHLRVAYLDLAWYQFYLFDVIAFTIAVLVVTLILFKKACSCLWKGRGSKSKLKVNKSKKSN